MFHLAQVNIGRIKAPLDDPIMAGFVALLDEINALADGSPGFVWRLQTEEGNATALRPYEDLTILVNLSVWESLEALHAFTYAGPHREVLASRRQWFERFAGVYVALWWVPAGHTPDPREARARLEHLQAHGPTPHAFTFLHPFAPPDTATMPAPSLASGAPER